jgi:formate hydrogenlyase subunit 6/NADH:ubiquinone oxidoreductase subunit I
VNFALRGKSQTPKPDAGGRREFIKTALPAAAGAVYLFSPAMRLLIKGRKEDAAGSPAGVPDAAAGNGAILPPGAKDTAHYYSRCIGCQACAAVCPVGILKVRGSPQPSLDYTNFGCQFNCVECGKVCPTGAIRALTVDEKHRMRVALSALSFERCVVNTRRQSCGACAEVCPTGALTMTPYPEANIPYLTRPVFDERYCIGCGACLAACPAEPRALVISGVARQTLTEGARPGEEAGDQLKIYGLDDFPF